MVEVILAIAAIAVTAAIVLGDVQPRPTDPPEALPPPFEERPKATPLAIAIENIDAPTEAYDPAVLTGEISPPLAQTTFALPLPSSQPLPEPPLGTPQPHPDPDRLIQTEVLLPAGGHEHALAIRKLLIGIAASGLVLGLMIMALARAIGALVH